MTEKHIKWEGKRFWVCEDKAAYTVYENGFTHSTPVQSFERNEDGLSIAIAYAKYLDGRIK
jgi:hypothetical protein